MPPPATFYVDEAGDGVLFGKRGRIRLDDPDAMKFFVLGMVRFPVDQIAREALQQLRQEIVSNPLYSSIPSLRPDARKTALAFHAKDDHPEIRAKVFELLVKLDFKLYAVIKDMRAVLRYVQGRNQTHPSYRYRPNELYDLTVRMLFTDRLHQADQYRITFARRGKSDRSQSLRVELEKARLKFLKAHHREHSAEVAILPARPEDEPCLQVSDYCLWAIQRCYEKHEHRFLHAIWPKVSLIRDVDDPRDTRYGSYWTRRDSPPDVEKIKNRWI